MSKIRDEGVKSSQPTTNVAEYRVEKWTPTVLGQFWAPFRWKKTRRIVITMFTDLFDESFSADFVAQMVSQVIAKTPQHNYQVTTKRADRMVEVLQNVLLPDNLWIGVHVETQHDADRRVPLLLQVHAAVRFVSCKPLRQFVDLCPWLAPFEQCYSCDVDCPDCPYNKAVFKEKDPHGPIDCQFPLKIDWVVVSGEVGPAAQPLHPEWVRFIRNLCRTAKVPFYFEGWGAFSSNYDGTISYTNVYSGITMDQPCPMYRVGVKRAGRLLDGETWDQMPEELQIEKAGGSV